MPDQTTRTTAPTRTTTPVEQTPAPITSASAAASTSAAQGLGALGWSLLIALVAALLVAGPLVARSQRRSAWDTQARGRRSLVWPPVRADLTAILTVQPRTEPPPAGEPGPPAFQT